MRPHRMIRAKLIFLRTAALAIFAGLALLLSSVSVTQGQCGAEAKLLVSLIEPQKSVEALHATGESHGDVYLFDTQNLELFAQGVILRLRTGSGSDLTVKVRSREAKKLENTSGEAESFKCEIDIVGDVSFTSYSLRSMWKGGIPPEAGEALYAALSVGQRRLLKAAGISIDWHRVKRIAHIKATDWRVRKAKDPTKVTAELWEWPGGKILELSAKTAPQNGSSTMQQLRDLALASGLAVEEEQQPKTSLVLHTVAGQVHGP